MRDGNLFTGGGVTAGIDFALTMVAELAGPQIAQAIQLQIEYAPAPPFDAGTPEAAHADVVQAARARGAAMREAREAIVARVASLPLKDSETAACDPLRPFGCGIGNDRNSPKAERWLWVCDLESGR